MRRWCSTWVDDTGLRVVYTGLANGVTEDVRRRGVVVLPELARDPAAARAALGACLPRT